MEVYQHVNLIKLIQMKLRIKGNSVRLRLTKTDVATIARSGYLEDITDFGPSKLIYALASKPEVLEMNARFNDNKIEIQVPESMVTGWPENDIVGFEANMPLPDGSSLYLLIEKDFACLDHTNEDQRDNYENPNKAC